MFFNENNLNHWHINTCNNDMWWSNSPLALLCLAMYSSLKTCVLFMRSSSNAFWDIPALLPHLHVLMEVMVVSESDINQSGSISCICKYNMLLYAANWYLNKGLLMFLASIPCSFWLNSWEWTCFIGLAQCEDLFPPDNRGISSRCTDLIVIRNN